MRARAELTAVAPSQTPVVTEAPIDRSSVVLPDMASPHIDHELHEWKQARQQRFKWPWRQLSLMATLCFGIASFVLPESVNDSLDWLLYGLMAASLYAGLRGRRRS
jgi:hypothetical protein